MPALARCHRDISKDASLGVCTSPPCRENQFGNSTEGYAKVCYLSCHTVGRWCLLCPCVCPCPACRPLFFSCVVRWCHVYLKLHTPSPRMLLALSVALIAVPLLQTTISVFCSWTGVLDGSTTLYGPALLFTPGYHSVRNCKDHWCIDLNTQTVVTLPSGVVSHVVRFFFSSVDRFGVQNAVGADLTIDAFHSPFPPPSRQGMLQGMLYQACIATVFLAGVMPNSP